MICVEIYRPDEIELYTKAQKFNESIYSNKL